ncbi:hypothetical protein Fmac_011893 [Flemingia macrophylla]|uniref:Uncharacterized protein n=1 Tax=Flemingia macrophylla TaxID=520843 RepID=A0ABD1MNS1_9FABA
MEMDIGRQRLNQPLLVTAWLRPSVQNCQGRAHPRLLLGRDRPCQAEDETLRVTSLSSEPHRAEDETLHVTSRLGALPSRCRDITRDIPRFGALLSRCHLSILATSLSYYLGEAECATLSRLNPSWPTGNLTHARMFNLDD